MVSLLIIHGFELKLASQGTRKRLMVVDGELTDRTYGSTISFLDQRVKGLFLHDLHFLNLASWLRLPLVADLTA